jgi:hypothetical protein
MISPRKIIVDLSYPKSSGFSIAIFVADQVPVSKKVIGSSIKEVSFRSG